MCVNYKHLFLIFLYLFLCFLYILGLATQSLEKNPIQQPKGPIHAG
jgi:hypothetical protein